MKKVMEELVARLGWAMPSDLAVALERLDQSAWPEIVQRWSRLTPTGFPIELTVTNADAMLRWTAEVAGPEVDEAQRLGLVAHCLVYAGQPVPASLLTALQAVQQGCGLQYGAWIGGRTGSDSPPRLKLYCEIPSEVSLATLPLPPRLRELIVRLPNGTLPRMIGVEPARDRIELYLRLPFLDPSDLRPLLTAAGYGHGVEALARSLPDGLRRLTGRRLGLSLANGAGGAIQVSLFVSARTLFPGTPELLRERIPALVSLPDASVRLTLVTLGLDPEGEGVAFAVGVTSVESGNLASPPMLHPG